MSEVPLYASRRGSPACLYLPAVAHPSGPLGFIIPCAVTWPRLPCQDLFLSLSLFSFSLCLVLSISLFLSLSLSFPLSLSLSLFLSLALFLSLSFSLSLVFFPSLSLSLSRSLSLSFSLSHSLLQRAGALLAGAYWWCAPDSGAWAEVDVTD